MVFFDPTNAEKALIHLDTGYTLNHNKSNSNISNHEDDEEEEEEEEEGNDAEYIDDGVNISTTRPDVYNIINSASKLEVQNHNSTNDPEIGWKEKLAKANCTDYLKDLKIKHNVVPNIMRVGNLSSHVVCLITQLTFSKLETLQRVAKHWTGRSIVGNRRALSTPI